MKWNWKYLPIITAIPAAYLIFNNDPVAVITGGLVILHAGYTLATWNKK